MSPTEGRRWPHTLGPGQLFPPGRAAQETCDWFLGPVPSTSLQTGHPQWQGDIKRNSSYFCQGCSLECAPVANAGALFRWGKQALGHLRSEGATENAAQLYTGRQGFREAFSKGQQPVTQMLTRTGDLFLEPGEIMESDGNVRMRAHLTSPLSLEPARQWVCVCLPGCIRCQPPEPF